MTESSETNSARLSFFAHSERWMGLANEEERDLYRKFFYNAEFTAEDYQGWDKEDEDFIFDSLPILMDASLVGRDKTLTIIWLIKGFGNVNRMRGFIVGSISEKIRLHAMLIGAIMVSRDDSDMDAKSMMKLIAAIKKHGSSHVRTLVANGITAEALYDSVKHDIDIDLLMSAAG